MLLTRLSQFSGSLTAVLLLASQVKNHSKEHDLSQSNQLLGKPDSGEACYLMRAGTRVWTSLHVGFEEVTSSVKCPTSFLTMLLFRPQHYKVAF